MRSHRGYKSMVFTTFGQIKLINMRILLLTVVTLSCSLVFAQSPFQAAYDQAPLVPHGLLESIAWNNTRMVHLSNEDASCTGLPRAYGIMGLHDQGQNYFRENGRLVAELSGISVEQQKNDAAAQILAYARAFHLLMAEKTGGAELANEGIVLREVLYALSEIPDSGMVNLFARDAQVYGILQFMCDPAKAQQFGFPLANFTLRQVFGENNYAVLSSKKITLGTEGIEGDKHVRYDAPLLKSIDYGPALWNPAATCNFSSRQGVAISAITIHTVQGTYAGCISWFQNCAASVSAHYVIRSSDGQVTQMVNEADKAWHVGSENPYTIGYEHEGYVNNPSWYTPAMYQASADLSRDIVNSGYGINPLRTFDGPATSGTNLLGGCIKIKGHQHYANQTHVDPGINWDWEHYYRLINNPPNVITLTASSGTLYDTGGPSGNYPDDQRQLWLIQPPTALNITLEFTSFNLENNWDYLYIYDGDSLDDPLIGVYTGTTSPGTVFSTGNSLLLEFRSDCSTTAAGWVANYTETTADATPPLTVVQASAQWYTDDFSIDITDSDAQSGVAEGYYLVASKSSVALDWSSDGSYGFTHESFEDGASNWWPVTGTYSPVSGAFEFTDELEQNSNTYMALDQNSAQRYLFEWDQTITSSSTNQRAGMHFFCDNPNLPNRGNSYFVYLRENDDKVQIYSVDNDVFTLQQDFPFTVNQGQTYNVKTTYNPLDGTIRVYIDNVFTTEWQDISPLASGAFISLRTGGCAARFDNVRVYQSRGTQVAIAAGFGELCPIESESAQPSALIRSLALDNAGNWSLASSESYLLDFTAPVVEFVNDGTGVSDIDTFWSATFEANWSTYDLHSDIAYYEAAIGSLPNLADVYPWTVQGTSNVLSTLLTNPIYNQMYYLSIRAYNNAGLSDQFMSDGQRFMGFLELEGQSELLDCILYPNPAADVLFVQGISSETHLELYDASGKLCRKEVLYSGSESISLHGLAQGTYSVLLRRGSAFVLKKLVVQ